MDKDPPHDLDRFKLAQAPVFETVLRELRSGRKRSHWMWFVFPQMRGLGRSPAARHFGIASLGEAQAYLADPVLSERLRLATEAVVSVEGRSLLEIFGSPDDQKFRSSMTLFAVASSDDPLFTQALQTCCDGVRDAQTLALLNA
ncbi:DUF1810 domain-containing protein [Shinella sp. CPCC 100929]|uniref:DUF1810 domain-containing protein n=1 Tax=Shinella lacus TaxID=2654216 RepID=A0ABT1RF04_9HYPH|nr:DUF1810 domain-containing protein [Shinella lacus]MCQ4633763.1 DUF1810 domain-containing protein [Shinella lacus]